MANAIAGSALRLKGTDVERLAYWLCTGLASLGTDPATRDDDMQASSDVPETGQASLCGGLLRASRIRYPLQVDGWQAVDEHLFEDQEYGVSVRYAHGEDHDRWIDVYFYPAGALTPGEFVSAARQEADLIRQAHRFAGDDDFDMGSLCGFGLGADAPGKEAKVEGLALDLSYAVDGTQFSSAMTLLLDRLYFVKARFSIEQRILSRADARAQLLAFTGRLQPRVAIQNQLVGDVQSPLHVVATAELPASGMREIRLQYQAAMPPAAAKQACEAADAD